MPSLQRPKSKTVTLDESGLLRSKNDTEWSETDAVVKEFVVDLDDAAQDTHRVSAHRCGWFLTICCRAQPKLNTDGGCVRIGVTTSTVLIPSAACYTHDEKNAYPTTIRIPLVDIQLVELRHTSTASASGLENGQVVLHSNCKEHKQPILLQGVKDPHGFKEAIQQLQRELGQNQYSGFLDDDHDNEASEGLPYHNLSSKTASSAHHPPLEGQPSLRGIFEDTSYPRQRSTRPGHLPPIEVPAAEGLTWHAEAAADAWSPASKRPSQSLNAPSRPAGPLSLLVPLQPRVPDPYHPGSPSSPSDTHPPSHRPEPPSAPSPQQQYETQISPTRIGVVNPIFAATQPQHGPEGGVRKTAGVKEHSQVTPDSVSSIAITPEPQFPGEDAGAKDVELPTSRSEVWGTGAEEEAHIVNTSAALTRDLTTELTASSSVLLPVTPSLSGVTWAIHSALQDLRLSLSSAEDSLQQDLAAYPESTLLKEAMQLTKRLDKAIQGSMR